MKTKIESLEYIDTCKFRQGWDILFIKQRESMVFHDSMNVRNGDTACAHRWYRVCTWMEEIAAPATSWRPCSFDALHKWIEVSGLEEIKVNTIYRGPIWNKYNDRNSPMPFISSQSNHSIKGDSDLDGIQYLSIHANPRWTILWQIDWHDTGRSHSRASLHAACCLYG
jgi:hypothetical protein